jgi:uncharacterized damage-inducible protein DinB
MKMLALAGFALIAFTALPLAAQEEHAPTAMLMQKHWKTSKDFTLAVAEVMPDADYSFKPNAEEMSFGDVMVHIALANASYASRAAGEKSPFEKPAKADKATAIKLLTDSYDYCIKVAGRLSQEDYFKMVGPEGRQMLAVEALWSGFTHAAHHRGQAEVYLRVKGLKPPAYQF